MSYEAASSTRTGVSQSLIPPVATEEPKAVVTLSRVQPTLRCRALRLQPIGITPYKTQIWWTGRGAQRINSRHLSMLLLRASRRACTASRLRIGSRYALGFRRRNGGAIVNKASILDVDDAMTGSMTDRSRSAARRSSDSGGLAGSQKSTLFLRYGHVSVRYTTSDGRQRVMNILGVRRGRRHGEYGRAERLSVRFCTAGIPGRSGSYNRDFVGVRVERCAPGAIDALHAYYEALNKRSHIEDGARSSSSSTRVSRRWPRNCRRRSAGWSRARPVRSNATEFLVRGKRAAPAREGASNRGRRVPPCQKDRGQLRAVDFSGIVFAGPRQRKFPLPEKHTYRLAGERDAERARKERPRRIIRARQAAPPYLELILNSSDLPMCTPSPARNLIYALHARIRRRHRERQGHETAVVDRHEAPAPAAAVASHRGAPRRSAARRSTAVPSTTSGIYGPRRRRGVARNVLVVVLNKIVTSTAHKLEAAEWAHTLFLVVRRVRVREAEEAPVREAADGGLDAVAVAQPRSDGSGPTGCPGTSLDKSRPAGKAHHAHGSETLFMISAVDAPRSLEIINSTPQAYSIKLRRGEPVDADRQS